ncbi:uncharacterized protein LOC102716551 [Oryza brachyantha]|uniref:uncharacterized protein LOC102716551 n=1 Tax=Oryza brachyantha TaxID=4533 RepID=UPI000776698F|nr:uncharacterized protein LOC102716551 [Oryza brachyantha]XP_015698789.1 uncharacterized protein LOC102716551 [Oryza brachyantha]XP_015698790.1 uncharacterized protein LOC102716551 [Oryza brachyantha]XP_015698791.1 uncharacterized protein LOC102716551 [Oryza brachyantha]
MDKGWMDKPRHTPVYLEGLERFLNFAFGNSAVRNKILCPCRKCVNSSWRERTDVREHLICEGFIEGYRIWMFHGETSSSFMDNHENDYDINEGEDNLDEDDDISNLLGDLACGLDDRGDLEDDGSLDGSSNEDAEALRALGEDAGQSLYPGCNNYSKLQFLVRLLHTKLVGGWTDKSFDMLLDLLNDAFPGGSTLPKNYNEAKKIVKCLGLGYVSIHACENDCILFWKDHSNANSCPKCKTSRWKSENKSLDGKRVHKVPNKVLHYFPIKKRLRRLFITPSTARDMRWHDEERTKDGLLRHPADSQCWKHVDYMHQEFGSDARNVRLAMATDGFNPFRSMNVNYSIWPVILIPYNLPPWKCMKQPNFILSLLIPGKHAPGNNMDVYFEPLVDDMFDLFVNGVRTYDASKGENFQLCAAILWSITDFPGLGYVVGCTTSGEGACADCHSNTCSLFLKNGSKTCYMGHRRFLDANHEFRVDADSFDGIIELRPAPTPLTREEILMQTEILHTVFGKDPSGKRPKKRKRKDDEPLTIWKRRSIWFKLPYWKDLLMRHNFDVMHIEKNVCDNIVGTLLGLDGKSKDNLNSRKDLQALNIRQDLHPIELEDDKFYLPAAPYSMSLDQKKLFCAVLKSVKFPDGCASDIRRNVQVNEKKIIGLKSQDSHVLLQHLLPLAVRRILPERVSAALIRVSNFFKEMYAPVIRISDMRKLQAEIAKTISVLETIFLPSFFDIMVHLMVHLPAQAQMAGPVHFRNMYPIERYLMRCKGYIRTKSHPEGSIAKGYLFDESLTFCSRYLQGETRFTRRVRNDEGLHRETRRGPPYFCNIGRGLVGKCAVTLDDKTWLQAHRYVLFNYDNIEPYLQKHNDYLSSIGVRSKREINHVQHNTFHEWFKLHVDDILQNGEEVSEEIIILAMQPMKFAQKRKNGKFTSDG